MNKKSLKLGIEHRYHVSHLASLQTTFLCKKPPEAIKVEKPTKKIKRRNQEKEEPRTTCEPLPLGKKKISSNQKAQRQRN